MYGAYMVDQSRLEQGSAQSVREKTFLEVRKIISDYICVNHIRGFSTTGLSSIEQS